MAVAGLALPKANLKSVTAKIKALHKSPQREEVKWATTKHWNIEIRKAYIDCLAELVRSMHVHLHIRFAPFSIYEHEGRRRIFDTVSKAYYQLLLHRAVRHYGSKYQLLIRPDVGECTSELKRFVPHLHLDGQLRYKTPADCIASLVCLDSKNEPLLQFLDVTLGALTAHRNGRHARPETSGAKTELAIHAYKAFGVSDLTKNTDKGRWFSIWNVIPRKRGPRG